MSRIDELKSLLASDDLSTTKLADESGVVLDIDSLQVLALNETGMFLVEVLREGASTKEELAKRLAEEFEVDQDVALKDVEAFLAEMGKNLLDKKRK
ncbi:MAG: PqqD family protein [bacterium]|nr:PqqD family protein [bacterium]